MWESFTFLGQHLSRPPTVLFQQVVFPVKTIFAKIHPAFLFSFFFFFFFGGGAPPFKQFLSGFPSPGFVSLSGTLKLASFGLQTPGFPRGCILNWTTPGIPFHPQAQRVGSGQATERAPARTRRQTARTARFHWAPQGHHFLQLGQELGAEPGALSDRRPANAAFSCWGCFSGQPTHSLRLFPRKTCFSFFFIFCPSFFFFFFFFFFFHHLGLNRFSGT